MSEFAGLYEVSNRGRIRSTPRVITRSNGVPMTVRGTVLAQHPGGKHGHLKVTLIKNGVQATPWVHRVVAVEWCERQPGQDYVLHGPAGPTINDIGNLRWGTAIENSADRKEFGVPYPGPRETCAAGHEMTEDNVYRPPKRPNDRHCKACQRKRVRDFRAIKSAS